MNWKITVLAVAIMFSLLLAWIGRYEIVSGSANGVAYRLDRWTGNVTCMQGYSGGQVQVK